MTRTPIARSPRWQLFVSMYVCFWHFTPFFSFFFNHSRRFYRERFKTVWQSPPKLPFLPSLKKIALHFLFQITGLSAFKQTFGNNLFKYSRAPLLFFFFFFSPPLDFFFFLLIFCGFGFFLSSGLGLCGTSADPPRPRRFPDTLRGAFAPGAGEQRLLNPPPQFV